MRVFSLVCAAILILLLAGGPSRTLAGPGEWGTVVLADPADPYYALAQEIARRETLPVTHSLAEALSSDPVFLLWVVAPAGLSDEVLVEFSLALRDRPSAVSVGIISGSTLDQARSLWQRAADVGGQRVVAVNAANPSGHIVPRIATIHEAGATPQIQPLVKENLIRSLGTADYLTFTGHGSRRAWHLEEGVSLRAADVPPLPPVVVGTANCNTFRIWEAESVALAFADQGAAAYAGFVYSPNEGYLIGEFDGLPFRYTWPEFPIGHVVQVQNHGTLQGFAQFPYYYLLGDPRIALQTASPYRLVEDRLEGDTRILICADAPAGIVPVRVPDGARYDFVEIPGVAAAGFHDPFYNSRLQMANVGADKVILFAHDGGDFTLRLTPGPSWHWSLGDLLVDSLDNTLLYLQQSDGDILSLLAAGVALVGVVLFLLRRRGSVRTLALAGLVGLAFAALHGIYALARLDHVTITSKHVAFGPLSLVGTLLLTGCGAFLFLHARSWWARGVALLMATFSTWAPLVFVTGTLGLVNVLAFRQELGVDLYNYNLGLLALGAFLFECVLLGSVLALLRAWIAWAGRGVDPYR